MHDNMLAKGRSFGGGFFLFYSNNIAGIAYHISGGKPAFPHCGKQAASGRSRIRALGRST